MEPAMGLDGTVTNSVTSACWSEPSGAIFDATGRYRYSLWRCWQLDAPTVAFIMLNPSTANQWQDDPTIRRCRQFAQSWGYGGVEIVNLFAYRATHPRELRHCAQPIGEANDRYIQAAALGAAQVVVAWGNHGGWLGRDRTLLTQLTAIPLFCLGRNQSGQPCHPLYRPRHTMLQPFRAHQDR